MFSLLCAATLLCCRFYADLKRPPWPRWLSVATASAVVPGRQQDGGGDEASASRDMSHDLRRPEMPATVRQEMQATLAASRVPS
ncbi:unnamed protein product [Urochloa humidicola]